MSLQQAMRSSWLWHSYCDFEKSAYRWNKIAGTHTNVIRKELPINRQDWIVQYKLSQQSLKLYKSRSAWDEMHTIGVLGVKYHSVFFLGLNRYSFWSLFDFQFAQIQPSHWNCFCLEGTCYKNTSLFEDTSLELLTWILPRFEIPVFQQRS